MNAIYPSAEALLPRIACLQGVEQNPVYHAEGDVYRHTLLVLEKLLTLPAYTALPAAQQSLLTAAALLHDLGKKASTRFENGAWTSPGHSAAGAGMVRELLITEFQMSGAREAIQAREALCMLTRLHMKPLHTLSEADPARAVRKMAAAGELIPQFTLLLLSILAEADQRGRVSDDAQERLCDVELFCELAKEQHCFYSPYPYPDAFTRYADLSGRAIFPDQPLYNGCWGTVIMLSGLPGTGKDTYYHRCLSALPMVSLDDLRREMRLSPTDNQGRVVQAAQERCRQHLRAREPFVFNATNLSPLIRGKWISLFHRYGACARVIYLETAQDERARRNASRKECVPESAVRDMLRRLEPPLPGEAEEVEWISV